MWPKGPGLPPHINKSCWLFWKQTLPWQTNVGLVKQWDRPGRFNSVPTFAISKSTALPLWDPAGLLQLPPGWRHPARGSGPSPSSVGAALWFLWFLWFPWFLICLWSLVPKPRHLHMGKWSGRQGTEVSSWYFGWIGAILSPLCASFPSLQPVLMPLIFQRPWKARADKWLFLLHSQQSLRPGTASCCGHTQTWVGFSRLLSSQLYLTLNLFASELHFPQIISKPA